MAAHLPPPHPTNREALFRYGYPHQIEITGRWVQPDTDYPIIHQWMNNPLVAQFWQQNHAPEQVRHYLHQQCASYHDVLVIELNQIPVAYSEIYHIKDDLLAYFIPKKQAHGEQW